ncbi:MAG: hypothetical protein BWY98_01159 [Tenericutes bacterium ADurb.BinA155]|nr:MAG: hypothetical protein BWY98_01159 [Tenericutes bacterium ADurb.BinA155]
MAQRKYQGWRPNIFSQGIREFIEKTSEDIESPEATPREGSKISRFAP